MKTKSKSIIFTIFIIVFIGAVVLFLGKGDESKNQNTEISSTQTLEQENSKSKLDSIKFEFVELETAYENLKTQIISKDDSIYFLLKEIERLELKSKGILNYQQYFADALDSLQNEYNNLKEVNQQLDADLAYYMTLDAEEVQIRTEVSDNIKLEPTPYFYGYIEIISPSVSITKALFKDRNGNVAKEAFDPIIINTNNLPKGLYYLSLYNKDKIVKVETVYKK